MLVICNYVRWRQRVWRSPKLNLPCNVTVTEIIKKEYVSKEELQALTTSTDFPRIFHYWKAGRGPFPSHGSSPRTNRPFPSRWNSFPVSPPPPSPP